MTEEDIARIQETIVKTVNGKIDAISKKQDEQIELNREHNVRHESDMLEVREHIKKMEPIMEAYTGGKALGGLLKWTAGVIISCGVVWAAAKGIFPTL